MGWPRPQAPTSLGRYENVLEHGHLLERARDLVGPPDPQPAPRGRIEVVDHPAPEQDPAPVGGQVAGDDAEQTGFTGSVRADDAN